jgi:hypothetical protein
MHIQGSLHLLSTGNDASCLFRAHTRELPAACSLMTAAVMLLLAGWGVQGSLAAGHEQP